ncbi:MAG: SMC-Scp complex subunit ScpB [Ruminococcus sp.]|jgi:segregation and condensation protein B|nr:SMC-Scp complex subunit ScpB [Ruminococcus sp.]
MNLSEGTSAVEAVLFASGDPVSPEKIAAACGFDTDLTEKLIRELNDRYEDTGSALTVLKLGSEYQLAVGQKYHPYIHKAFDTKRSQPLSAAALEVLTIAAYNQPVSKGFIESIRGVDSSSLVNTLTAKGLLEESGRLDVPGRPIAYKTTAVFLRTFGLSSLADLPPVPTGKAEQMEIGELTQNTEYRVQSTENEPLDIS